jgi:hypothetical protein
MRHLLLLACRPPCTLATVAGVEQAASSILHVSCSGLCRGSVTVYVQVWQLIVGLRGAETETGLEAGSCSGEADDVFKSMDAGCKVCMQEIKVRHH